MRPNRRARGGPEGDIHIMGALDIDSAAHHSPVHKLHHADAQDPGSTRDRTVHLRWYVAMATAHLEIFV